MRKKKRAPLMHGVSRKGETMFTDKELEATVDYCDRKIDDLLNNEGGSDLDYIRNLQTLITLKDAANQKIQRIKDR
jgi:hypothetical protein